MFKIIRTCPCFLTLMLLISLKTNIVLAQEKTSRDSGGFVIDTFMKPAMVDSLANLKSRDVEFDIEEAIEYLSSWYESDIWNSKDDPLRKSIRRLLFEATNDPVYVARDYVRQYDWAKIKIPESSFFMWDTIHIPIPSESERGRSKQKEQDIFDLLMADTDMTLTDTMRLHEAADTILSIRDSLMIVDPGDLGNIFVQTERKRPLHMRSEKHDSIIIVISDTLKKVISGNPDFPFLYYDYPLVGDSIQSAVNKVMQYIEKNDSSRVIITGTNNSIPVWLGRNTSRMTRLWLKNEWDEEVSVWVMGLIMSWTYYLTGRWKKKVIVKPRLREKPDF